jgi:hypothetical protein
MVCAPKRGRRETIKEANKERSLEWFAEWAAPFVDAHGLAQKVLIPIPSSKTVESSAGDFRTAQIADAVARYCRSARVAPVLRWKRPIASASEEGGPRKRSRSGSPLQRAEFDPGGPLPVSVSIPVSSRHIGGSGHPTSPLQGALHPARWRRIAAQTQRNASPDV